MPTAITPPAPPAAPAPLPPHRAEAFARGVLARLRAMPGVDVAATLATLRAEQRALAASLRDPAFVATVATAYQSCLNAQHTAANATPMADATRDIGGTLARRAADADAFTALLADPNFIAQLRDAAAQPAPAPVPYALPAVKQAEVIRRLVQPQDVDGAEPTIHVAFSAQGQRAGHEALAALWQPETGPLVAPLTHALTQRLPGLPDAQVAALAREWLTARYNPARATADGLAPEGALTQAAMRQSLALAPLPVSPAPAPATTIIAPPAVAARLATPELMVDML